MKTLFAFAVLAIGMTFGSAAASAQSKSIVDIAVGSPDHTTLVAAVKAADLVGTLQGAGPFTVFAPANSAFDKLPAGTVATLLKPENKATLAKILTYHVVAANVPSSDVVAGDVDTVEGSKLTITTDGGIQVGGATVVTPEDRPVVLVLELEHTGFGIPDRLERVDVVAHVHEADVQQDQERQQEKDEQPDVRHADDEALAGHGER